MLSDKKDGSQEQAWIKSFAFSLTEFCKQVIRCVSVMELLLWIIVLKLLIHSWKWIGLASKFWCFRGGNLIEYLKSTFPFSCVTLEFECTELMCWLTVGSKLWLINGWLNWFCPTGLSCWIMHIEAWVIEVTGAWKFDGTWEAWTKWLLHNWLGCATYCLTGKVLAVLSVKRLWKLQRSSNSVWLWSHLVWEKIRSCRVHDGISMLFFHQGHGD